MKPEQRLINRLITIFGEPKTDDPVAYLNEVEKALAGWPHDLLDRAGDEIIRTSRFWPRPAEIIEKAEAIAARIAASKPRKPAEPDLPPPTPEQRERARQILAAAVAAMTPPRSDQGLPDVSRHRFETMMRNSPNRHLYAHHSALTRRIIGEREE